MASSPRPRSSTPRPGNRCSTTSCGNGRRNPANPSFPSTRFTTTRSTSTASCALTARARSLQPGHSHSRGKGLGAGRAKDTILLQLLQQGHVETYDGSIRYVHAAREAGLRTAVVSSSKHCEQVLASAGIADLFDARIDGIVAAAGASGRQAGARYLPRGRARFRRRTRAGGRLRRRAVGRRGRPGGTLRLRGRRRSRGPSRRAAPPRRRRRGDRSGRFIGGGA